VTDTAGIEGGRKDGGGEQEAAPVPVSVVAEIVRAAVRDELDSVLPHLVAAIKRDRAFDALAERLHNAEGRLEARRERPIAVALLRFLHRLRHLDFDEILRESFDIEIAEILHAAGFEEFGEVGDPYDPARHEPLEGRTVGGTGTVAEVHASGLSSFGDVIVRAQVRLRPAACNLAGADLSADPHPISPARGEEP
jgi:hypothetical protein